MIVFIQDKMGDHNLEIELTSDKPLDAGVFDTYVRAIKEARGYYTRNRDGKRVFVPWHQIQFIEER
jgi:hypothetical protein